MRCPNCNEPLEEEWCDACGMDLPRLRRAALHRLISKLGIFLLGILALVPATRIYPPLEIDRMFIFFGVLFVVALGLAVRVEYQLRRNRPAETGSRIFRSLVVVPWILTGLLLANGRFDRDPPQRHQAQVAGTFRSGGMAMTHRLVLPSWRSRRRWERVAVSAKLIAAVRTGDTVQVLIKPGLAGIAWVAGVEKVETLPLSPPPPELKQIRQRRSSSVILSEAKGLKKHAELKDMGQPRSNSIYLGWMDAETARERHPLTFINLSAA